ncbi:alpha,alpha-trehalose-phosphate synthase (UDP-forming) [Entomomonas asaccharolytica]|uniref:Trehalose-6-phosphate synthase n=1 Tax=Entomomonas asaccharolytica TaxID=2785331 RepID=A0A974NFD1_9GAMM|nr:trehalose-6-phosphate synthase [Entomomonas asaccharolytica]QQP85479.1 trehalose-6-phosphate synthase [Entomomonas asaccharolytica]
MSRLVIVSNRIPNILSDQPNTGGLVNGLLDAIQNKPCTWIGWNGEISDNTKDFKVHKKNNTHFITMSLSAVEYNKYYCQFANQVIWPIFHSRTDLCHYHPSSYNSYKEINCRFAKLVQLSTDVDDIVWVHDYHLLSLAKKCRNLGVRNSLGFFLHIPFPNLDGLRTIPKYKELLEAMLSYDLLGFQTKDDLDAFKSCINQCCSEVFIYKDEILYKGTVIKVGVYPVGICVDKIKKTIKRSHTSQPKLPLNSSNHQIIINADRLDYIKGLANCVLAYEKLLQTNNSISEKVILHHINALTREYIPDYQNCRHELESEINRINKKWQKNSQPAINYTNKAVSREKLLALLHRADVGLVTSFKDGMNLIAKEFVAAQDANNPGVLVLSKYAGVANEFAEGALLIDSYDIDNITKKLVLALKMPKQERKERHKLLYEKVLAKDAQHWFDTYLTDLTSSVSNKQAICF